MADMFEKAGFKVSRKVETSIRAAKLVLLCVGFVTTLIFFKVALLSSTFNLLLSTLPPLWISLRSWLSPPYIYIILNFIIIIVIAASSTQSKSNPLNNFKNTTSTANLPWQDSQEEELNPIVASSIQSKTNPINNFKNNTSTTNLRWQDSQEEELNPISASSTQSKTNPINNFKNNTSTTNLRWQDSQEEELNPNFSINEKSIDNPLKETSDSGQNKQENITGEAEEEEEEEETLDTLEDTWRLIMEGKGKAGRPELKKSDTSGTPPRVVIFKEEEEEDVGGDDGSDPVAWAQREMRKSNTFNDRATLIKREIVQKSLTHDELTQRVEAFINNFRLQRQ